MPHGERYFSISKLHFTFKNPGLPVCIKWDWDVFGLPVTFRNPPRRGKKKKKKKDVITSLVHLRKDVIKRGSKMKPCQLVRTQKVILPSALRREGDTQPYHYWHERTCWCQRCCRQKSSGVAKFINVSFWEDVMSFCCPWGWKLESTCSRQHTIILISFVLPPVCHL